MKKVLLITSVLATATLMQAQLKVHSNGEVSMNTTTITTEQTSNGEALKFVSPLRDNSSYNSSLSFYYKGDMQNPYGTISFNGKDTGNRNFTVKLNQNRTFQIEKKSDQTISFEFSTGGIKYFYEDFLGVRSKASGDGLKMPGFLMYVDADNKDWNVFSPQHGALGNSSYLIGTPNNYWDRAYVVQPYFRQSPVITSDARAKERIEEVDVTSVEKGLFGLRPVTYTLKEQSPDNQDPALRSASSLGDTESTGKKYYGLIAQEVKELFPDIVEYDKDADQYGIRYTELIPIMIATIQAQQVEIETLKSLIQGTVEQRSSVKKAPTSLSSLSEQFNEAVLFGNVPNPFSDVTTIEYFLPTGTQQAYVAVTDLQGRILQSYPCNEFGHRAGVVVKSDHLSDGIYLYSLIVDGVEIATKKMVIRR